MTYDRVWNESTIRAYNSLPESFFFFFEEEVYGSPLNLLIGKLKEQEN